MEERTCAHCGAAPARTIYCSDRCKDAAGHRRRYVPTGNPPGPMPKQIRCDASGCDRRHFAKGLCRNHYYQARWASGRDGAATETVVLHGIASLYGACAPKVKPVSCAIAVGLLVECPRCRNLMAGTSPHSRCCTSCWTTVELNPEEVSWVTFARHTTRPSRPTPR